jgi:signal peptidase II
VESGAADERAVAGAGVAAASARRLRIVAIAVAAIVTLDQLTKVWAVAALSDAPLSIIGDDVEFHLTRNPGGAFGRFRGMTPLLALAAVLVAVFLVRAVKRARDMWTVAALTLVLGGALGNLCDRFARSPGVLRGHVVDFVKVGWFPVFNVADSCITIGATLLVVRSLFPPPEPAEPADPVDPVSPADPPLPSPHDDRTS